MRQHGWAAQDVRKYNNMTNFTIMNSLRSDYDLLKQRRQAESN